MQNKLAAIRGTSFCSDIKHSRLMVKMVKHLCFVFESVLILCGFVVYTAGTFPCSLSSYFFIPFSIMITSLGEEAAGGWLRFVIVTLPGFSISFCYTHCKNKIDKLCMR